ncbi:alpha/beta fold hydrolase [Streptomyces benahoarensis]|uniref:Alpha/beta fold hydrolase n=1 Tax=Streptomyces benahoarensis TaxID=2595054 RepID=A0A553ZDL1_9ACTN|nr:alpha/beta hydrolase [Streptomyces benahoarensis]TSB21138.1 alpha/beta fold hydrolase [Streptomyces benahoarensis]TSB39534.1 alpha/beta fold hydrolase [Streptomyces benahoarensis]
MSEETIRSLSLGGVSYAYRLLHHPDGATDPVMVLGGALQGMFGWPQMEERLKPVASVITADLPGMGTAEPLPPGPSTELLCRAIEHILDDLGVARINLFGFSYGAGLAFGCARRFPARIARLALGGVPSHITDEQCAHWERAAEELRRGAVDAFATLATDGLLCLDEGRYVTRRRLAYRYVRRSMLQAARTSPHALDSLCRAVTDRPDFSGGLSGVPTLVFSGAHDTVTSPAHQQRFAATLDGSRFLVIPDADHWVVLERPQAVADLTARFFTDRPLSSAPALAPVARDEEPTDGAAAYV